MMSLATKLGQNIDGKALAVKKINVSVGDVSFSLRVRIPLKKEIEVMNAKVLTPDQAKVEAIYTKLSKPLLQTIEEGGEKFLEALNQSNKMIEILENDLIVDGTSLRQIASYQAVDESRVEQYFHLLVSETDEPITENYDAIMAEFPEFVVKEILAEIQNAIHPDYSAAKKN
jgi:hypothetical protein